jgi:hypothetical protein
MPELRLDILPPAQRRVGDSCWTGPGTCGRGDYLAGGTALVLHLGHRQSVDFDFFSQLTDPSESALTWLEQIDGFTTRDIDRRTIHGDVGGMKLSFIGRYRYGIDYVRP